MAQLPPSSSDKRYWRRYVYLWVKYALFEELDTGDVERARDVYRAALELIPHRTFTFAKVCRDAVRAAVLGCWGACEGCGARDAYRAALELIPHRTFTFAKVSTIYVIEGLRWLAGCRRRGTGVGGLLGGAGGCNQNGTEGSSPRTGHVHLRGAAAGIRALHPMPMCCSGVAACCQVQGPAATQPHFPTLVCIPCPCMSRARACRTTPLPPLHLPACSTAPC